jgi:hypothetical protein
VRRHRYSGAVVPLLAVALLRPLSGWALECSLTSTDCSFVLGGVWFYQSLERPVRSDQRWFLQMTRSDPIEETCNPGFRSAWLEDGLTHHPLVESVPVVPIDAMPYRRFGPDVSHPPGRALTPPDAMRLVTARLAAGHDGHDKRIQPSTVDAATERGRLATLIAALFGMCAVAHRRIRAI